MPILEKKRRDLVTAVSQRFFELISDVEPAVLRRAVDADSDISSVFLVLQSPLVMKTDHLGAARLRGVQVQKTLLGADGGLESVEAVSERLGITRQAVHKRMTQGKLIALERGRAFMYPAWQFNGPQVLPGVEESLAALGALDRWTKFSFFLSKHSLLKEKRPIDLLRKGQIASVLSVASDHGEQGAY